MVNLWCSASDRVRVRRRTSTEAFQTCDAGRARVQLPSEAGTPDMTIGGAGADRAGARPYRIVDGNLPKGGFVISREDVAHFMIGEAENAAHLKQIVGVAN